GPLVGADPAFIAEGILVSGGEVPVRTVEDVADGIAAAEHAVADSRLVVRDPVPHFELDHLAASAGSFELERARKRVWRLLVVIEHEMAAHRRHTSGKPDPETPSRRVDLVNPL